METDIEKLETDYLTNKIKITVLLEKYLTMQEKEVYDSMKRVAEKNRKLNLPHKLFNDIYKEPLWDLLFEKMGKYMAEKEGL